MNNPSNKPLLVTLCLALLALTSYQTIKLINGDQVKVLGETTSPLPYVTPFPTGRTATIAPSRMPTTVPPLPAGGIPCGVIAQLQQQFCSNVYPTSVISPIPTQSCSNSFKSQSYSEMCQDGYYRYTTIYCTNDIVSKQGSATTCKSKSDWNLIGESFCKSQSTCPPTVTSTKYPTSTSVPTPTIHSYPTATPTASISCTEGARTCNGYYVSQCTLGKWYDLYRCAYGCLNGGCQNAPTTPPTKTPAPSPTVKVAY